MVKIMVSPSRYIQGPGVISKIGEYIMELGERAMVIGDKIILSLIQGPLTESLRKNQIAFHVEEFQGEATRTEVDRLKEIAQRNKVNLIIGAGGGKALDTAKAVAYYLYSPMVIVPTIASTDAPTSSVSVLYTENHIFSEVLSIHRNPNMVVVDTEVITQAPVRFLVAGMGDALSKKFEVEACIRANATNSLKGNSTLAALYLARLAYDILMKYGLRAKLAVEKKVIIPAVEEVVEAIILLSGLAWENGGLAAAHSLYDGFSVLEETHKNLHGEIVSFGILVQLVMEGVEDKVIEEVLAFCHSVGLPITLEELGLKEIGKDKIMKVAQAACAEGRPIHNMHFSVCPSMVLNAIIVADVLGRRYN
jgi:glycerol dehydrogenase